ncbi:MAG: argininosuccinate lyase [Candidatus Lokiarchaeota archaeon]|nr:argininosuccinate lyase [Candidatus Lokiarchaeota archaeon]
MPKDLFRIRLDAPLDKKALKFISSLKEDLWIAEEDIIGTEVHDIMLFDQNLLNKSEIKQILTSLEDIREKILANQIELKENFEDIHPFIEQRVIDEIGIEIGGKTHTGRSRNDQISVDLRLKIRKELNNITKELFTLFDVLLNVSKKNIDTYMPLYTHLQKGQLGVFSHYINNYLAQILRSLERLEEIYKRVNKNPLGACAIGGTSINIDRLRTAELLGFDGIIYNSIDAVSSRDYIYETLMGLSSLAIHFSRIAEDLIIWSTSEFNFVEIDDAYCSVSSVMPQKKNPDTLELIRSKSTKIMSNLFNAIMIIKSIPTGYFRDFQDLKSLLKSSFEILFSIIEMFKGIFSTLIINKEKLSKAVNESFILALDLAELLVQQYNIPFRQSHKIVALLVKNSEKPEDMLNKEKIEKYIFDVRNKETKVSKNLIQTLENLDLCLEKRISQGSPAEKEVKLNIDELIGNKEALHKLFLKRLEMIKNAKVLREKVIKALLS